MRSVNSNVLDHKPFVLFIPKEREGNKKHQRISIMHKLLTKAVYEYYVYVAKEHQRIEREKGGREEVSTIIGSAAKLCHREVVFHW